MNASAASPPPKGRMSRVGAVILGLFSRNVGAKIAALLLAWLVWFTVRLDLTGEFKDALARVNVFVDPGIMLIQDPPDSVEINWSGPRSRIRDLEAKERTEILLRIRESDLSGKQSSFLFSVGQGNIEHAYGDQVTIDEIRPSPITIKVAREATKTLRVRKPEVTIPPEYEMWDERELKLLSGEITVRGPEHVLETLTEVRTAPVVVGRTVRVDDDEEVAEFKELVLDLHPDVKAQWVSVESPAQILCQLKLVRSGEEQVLPVPFRIYQSQGKKAPKLEPRAGNALKERSDGTWDIILTFQGAPSDLALVKNAIDNKTIKAYVKAEDADPADSRVNYLRVYLEGFENFSRRVRLLPPASGSLEFNVVKEK